MDIKNTHRETANDLVKGKVKCERVFQHAIARYQIPQRTSEQQKRVEGKRRCAGRGEVWGGERCGEGRCVGSGVGRGVCREGKGVGGN